MFGCLDTSWLDLPYCLFLLQIDLWAPWGFIPLTLPLESQVAIFFENGHLKVYHGDWALRVYCASGTVLRWRHCVALCSRAWAPGGGTAAAEGWRHERCGDGCWE